MKVISILYIFQFNFSDLKGKVVLIENTASLWGTTVRDFTQVRIQKLQLISRIFIYFLITFFNENSRRWTTSARSTETNLSS